MIALALAACAYTVTITSSPMPAQVLLPDGRTVVTPAQVELPPLRAWPVVVSAPGHRPVTADVRRAIGPGRVLATAPWHRSGWKAGTPRGEIRVVLVSEHGPSGTWSELPADP